MDEREGGSVEKRRGEDERDPRATREAEEAHGG
ncbi:GTPase activator, partial [Micromonospora provocatoris]